MLLAVTFQLTSFSAPVALNKLFSLQNCLSVCCGSLASEFMQSIIINKFVVVVGLRSNEVIAAVNCE